MAQLNAAAARPRPPRAPIPARATSKSAAPGSSGCPCTMWSNMYASEGARRSTCSSADRSRAPAKAAASNGDCGGTGQSRARCQGSFGRASPCAAGTLSASCALVPPMPKELVAAKVPCPQAGIGAPARSTTASSPCFLQSAKAAPTYGFSARRCSTGGAAACASTCAASSAPVKPAAPSV